MARVMLTAFVCWFAVSTPLAQKYLPAQQAIVDRAGWIKVLLSSGIRSLNVGVSGPVRVIADGRSVYESSRGGTFTVSGSGGTVTVQADGKSVGSGREVVINPTDRNGSFRTERNSYRGRLMARAASGGFNAINQIRLDDWLKGVLPAEIGDSHPEALKAQAVAARSEAIHKLKKPPHESSGYDFCTGVHCQAYKGISAEIEAANRACEETFGVVLLAEGDVMDGVYHNVCGGVTAGAEDVWDSKPVAGLVPVIDQMGARGFPSLGDESSVRRFIDSPSTSCYCNSAHMGYPNYAKKYYRWSKTLTAAEIGRMTGVSGVRDVRVVERRRSGRVRKLQIVWSSGSKTIDKELPIRKALDLWSGLFYVDVVRSGDRVDKVVITGAGNGHGVGLCQMGARIMAASGVPCERILQHYYRGAQIAKIYRP